MSDFSNTEIAFRNLSNKELRKSYRVFHLVKHAWLVRFGKPFLMLAIKLHLPIRWAVGGIYRQFVGGKSLEDALPVMHSLAAAQVKTIPDYSAEGGDNELSFDATAQEVCKSIHFAADHRDLIPFAVFKPSGITSFELLQLISSGKELSAHQSQTWDKSIQRWETIFSLAHQMQVSVMVDAEESWIQKAVDDLAFSFSLQYNRDKAIVFNTLQMYRNDRLEFLQKTIEFGKQNQVFMGIKFVRGAYWEKENKYAMANGCQSAVYQSKSETDSAFNQAATTALTEHEHLIMVCASHNEKSAQLLMEQMKQLQMQPSHSSVWFAQLYGMSNHISFNLAADGYNVAKYLPYAPVETVMPYLIRRAEENTAVKGESLRELSLLKLEIHRRRGNDSQISTKQSK